MISSRWLTHRAIAVVLVLAILATGSQVIVHHLSRHNAETTRLLSESGEQRTLSQRAAKALLRASATEGSDRMEHLLEAQTALLHLGQAHAALAVHKPALGLGGSESAAIDHHLAEVTPALGQLNAAAAALGSHLATSAKAAPARLLSGVQVGERAFLSAMDGLSYEYEIRSRARVEALETVALGLLAATLLTLVLLAWMLRPAAQRSAHNAHKSAPQAVPRVGDRAGTQVVFRARDELSIPTVAVEDVARYAERAERVEIRRLIDAVMCETAQRFGAAEVELSARIGVGVPLFVPVGEAHLGDHLSRMLASAIASTAAGAVSLLIEADPLADRLRFTVRATCAERGTTRAERTFYSPDGALAYTVGEERVSSAPRADHETPTLAASWSAGTERAQDTPAAPVGSIQPPAPLREALRRRRVLIAGGTPPSRQQLADWLRGWGVHTYCVGSPADALAALEPDSDFDAFLLDSAEGHAESSRTLIGDLNERLPDVPAILLESSTAPSVKALPASTTILRTPTSAEKLYQTLSRAIAESALRILQPVRNDAPRTRSLAPGTVRILIAEDHAVQRTVIVRTLEGLGAHVHSVGNGLEAVEAFEPDAFDLVFLDIQMPVMDGLTAAQLVRRESSWVRIVALTGMSGLADRSVFSDAGFDALLFKPLRREAAARLIAQAMGGRDQPITAPLSARSAAATR